MSLFKNIFSIIWPILTLGILVILFLQVLNIAEKPSQLLSETLSIPMPNQKNLPSQEVTTLKTTKIKAYFINLNLMCLERLDIDVEYGESVEATCRNVLSAMRNHENELLLSPLPKETDIRGIYLLESGELVIDLPAIVFKALPIPKTATTEMLWVYSLTNTLLQSEIYKDIKVSSLKILIEGSEPSVDFFEHINIVSPFSADYSSTCTNDS
ncbi:MAG: GerMN domain-containing protein [Candidatus Hydrogenedentes bacterium]|nr:GerMN domain-containing protein [Candidatus Hydrogenedentota bacterium]